MTEREKIDAEIERLDRQRERQPQRWHALTEQIEEALVRRAALEMPTRIYSTHPGNLGKNWDGSEK